MCYNLTTDTILCNIYNHVSARHFNYEGIEQREICATRKCIKKGKTSRASQVCREVWLYLSDNSGGVIPGDFLFESGGVWRVELDSETHGKRRLS